MAKKKITAEQPKVAYRDSFQETTSGKIEEIGRSLDGQWKYILYGIIALVIVGIGVALISNWSKKANGAASLALAKAIDVQTAQITETPVPNNPNPTFKTEKERAEKAVEAFQKVVDGNFGSPYREQAQYFIAINKLTLDRENGFKELEGLTVSPVREVSGLAKFALAEAKFADGKLDESLKLYDELANTQNLPVALDTINFQRAVIMEKQGKKDEAASIFFDLAKVAREAKDGDGKNLPLTETARESAEKLQKLNADKFKELPAEPAPEFGGMPGMPGM